MKKIVCLLILLSHFITSDLFSQDTNTTTDEHHSHPINIKGVFPNLTVMADGIGSTSETGIGALIPWANKLWAIGYVAHIRGEGIGLYEINEDMTMRLHPESVTGTFANRMVHWASKQAIIGPHVISSNGMVRTFKELSQHRLTATMNHLKDPENLVYFLTMEGLLFEANVKTLHINQLFDLTDILKLPKNIPPHFKGGYTQSGRVVVANNTYEEEEFQEKRFAGCLAEWDGDTWRIIERNPFVEVAGCDNQRYGGATIFATGWNKSSVILRVYNRGQWSRYLLPKASHSFDHTWNTEWMRIRNAQTERFLLDIHGMFYELPPFAYDGKIWGIRPICSHLRVIPDYCYWRGLFVLAGDQTDHDEGQPQSGLWFGNIDELWQMGKPKGWGGPWWETNIEAGTYSDPFLMTGFDKKVLHLAHNLNNENVQFKIEVDFLGNGSWKEYKTFDVSEKGYLHHEFPDGFSVHWIRLTTNKKCKATAYFIYN